LSEALLEIDPETNVLNRVVLWTVREGQPKGIVTYSLIDNPLSEKNSTLNRSTQTDDRYRLQSHLAEGALIESGTLATPSQMLSEPAS
jgi:hypothetical protein